MATSEQPLILHVDDDEDIRVLVAILLESAGYRVRSADGGQAGLEAMKEQMPSLILVDVMMPDMSGYEFCERLHCDQVDGCPPIVFATALSKEQDRATAFAAGAVGYLVKPIDRAELLEVIARHIDTGKEWTELSRESDAWTRSVVPQDFLLFKQGILESLGDAAEMSMAIETMGPMTIHATLLGLDFTEARIAEQIAQALEIEFVGLIPAEAVVLDALPLAFARKNLVVPLESEGKLKYVLANPYDWELLDLLDRRAGEREYSLAVAPRTVIRQLFKLGSMDHTGEETDAGIETISLTPVKEIDGGVRIAIGDVDAAPVVTVANNLLLSAIDQGASDIHLEPREDRMDIRFRVDGDMQDVLALKPTTGIMLMSRLKAIGGMDIAQKRKPQDGTLEARMGERRVKLRLATTSGPYGESMVIRVLDVGERPRTLQELGMSDEQATRLYDMAERSSGMILVVGPTGSGKTTTLYSLLTSLDTERRSLMSVEDPVEYIIPRANQQQVNVKAGITFESLLKSAVRQDPDVLFLGEIRDSFSARTALDFASTGHLTMSTLHTANATTAVNRLERLGVEREMMADALLCIVAQRLIKRLCPHCREIGSISDTERAMLEPYTEDIPEQVARPVGCPRCRSGYRGRVGIQEMLVFDQEVKEWTRSGMPTSQIRAKLMERGDRLGPAVAIDRVRSFDISPTDAHNAVLSEEEEGSATSPTRPTSQASSTAEAADISEGMSIGVSERAESPNGHLLIGSGRAPRIVVADDDDDTRELLMRVLRHAGYEVIPAQDGVEALGLVDRNDVDMVLTDAHMPGLDGLGLLRTLAQKHPNLPVMLLTGTAEADAEAEALRMGAADYIRKPARRDVLLLRVERAFRNVEHRKKGE